LKNSEYSALMPGLIEDFIVFNLIDISLKNQPSVFGNKLIVTSHVTL